MLFKRNKKTETNQQTSSSETLNHSEINRIMSPEDALRQRIYERIAQGNALAEIEESISRKWHN